MKLRDTFLFRQPAPARHPLEAMKQALAGIGDRDVRQAQDFLWSMGVAPVAGAEGVRQWMPSIGDRVEFTVPNSDGMRRAGTVYQFQGRDAIVQVNAGEYNIVPLGQLQPLSSERRRQSRREAIQAALGPKGPQLHETRALIPLGETDYACTIEHIAGLRPTGEDIEAYVEARYPGARIVDGDDSHPGKIGLVLSFGDPEMGRRALHASRQVFGQLETPEEPPSSRENATGIGTEEIEGTGKIADSNESAVDPGAGGGDDLAPLGGDDDASIISTEKKHALLAASAAAFQKLAAAYPHLDIEETSIEETKVGFISHYRLTENGRPLFLREGELTTVLAEGAAPAIGTVAASDAGVTVHLAHVLVADYESGTGPLSIHENEPGAADSGSYVVKADGLPQHGGGGVPGAPMPAHGDFDQEGVPLQQRQIHVRKDEIDRYEQEMRERELAEQRAKERRLMRQRELQQPAQTPGTTPGKIVYTGERVEADAVPPATEEDGEHRETIGGPGLHIAVDDTAESYWEEYFGSYGEQLTKDVATRVGMIRQAWTEGAGQEPTADELLWVLGVLDTPLSRTAADPNAPPAQGGEPPAPGAAPPAGAAAAEPPSPAASAGGPGAATAEPPGGPGAADMTQLANALISAMHMDPRAKQRLDPLIAKELAKLPPGLRQRYRPGSAQVYQTFLPRVLQSMPAKQRDALVYEYAPQFGGQKPGLMTRIWRGLPGGGPGVEKTKRQMEYGQQLLQETGQPMPGMPATPRAPSGQPARPATPAQPAQPGGGSTLSPGMVVTGPDGKKYKLTAPTRAVPAEGEAPAAAPAVPAAGPPQPEAPAAPAQPEAPPGAPPPPAAPSGQPQPTAGAKAGWLNLPKGAKAFDVDGKSVTLREAVTARVLSSESGVTFVRTSDGRVLALQAPGSVAQASLRTADSASDNFEGRRPPAKNQLRMRIEGLSRYGDYLVCSVVWDVDAAKDMAPANVVANVKSFVKQRSGEKEFIDLGFIGKPNVVNVDLEMGLAEVRFQTSNPGAGPTEIVEREDATYHELV